MAIDITLKIYQDSRETKLLGRELMWFGRNATKGRSTGWSWVESQGMEVAPPNVLDDPRTVWGHVVTKSQLRQWIIDGYLSFRANGEDNSTYELDSYPDSATYRIFFLDWS